MLYFKVRLRDYSLMLDAEIDGKEANSADPYLEALVKETQKSEPGDEHYHYKVLKILEEDENALTLGRIPEFGDYINPRMSCTEILKTQEMLTNEEILEADGLLEEFDNLHKKAPYHIHGIFCTEVDDMSAKIIEERDFDVPSEINSLEKAEIWLINNHPDYHMGCSISQDCPSGNFMATAIPCAEYDEKHYKTWEGRRDYAEKRLQELWKKVEDKSGIVLKVGKVEHDEKGNYIGEEYMNDLMRDKHIEDRIPGKAMPEKALEKNTVDKDYFIIWQRNDEHMFVDLEHLRSRGIEPVRGDYTPVYMGEKVASLDDVYANFQHTEDTPSDYTARSVSVGDIITKNDNGRERSYFVEPTGFKQVPDFTKDMYLVNGIIFDKQKMSQAEIEAFENRYGIDIDGSKTIGSDNRAVDIMDRDLNGNGYADRYDDDDDYEPVRA